MPPNLIPPVVPFSQWYREIARTTKQGQHKLFVGPTQSGKTTLARIMLRQRQFVVVLGTKAKDSSLDAYEDEGYRRITHWPPTKKELEPNSDGSVRLILWPKMTEYRDLRAHRETYRHFFGDAFAKGGWAIGCDEGLWVASNKGLGLDAELAAIAFGGASNKVSLYLCIQRPAGLSRVSWSSVYDAFVFHCGITSDVRELSSLGIYDPRDAAVAIQKLRGHQFLRLPCRGDATWSVSEVPTNWL